MTFGYKRVFDYLKLRLCTFRTEDHLQEEEIVV